MSPDRSHLCMSLGRSPLLTATLDAVAAGVPTPPTEPHPASNNNMAAAVREARMRLTLRERLAPPPPLWQHSGRPETPPHPQAPTALRVGWLARASGIKIFPTGSRCPSSSSDYRS